MYITPSLYKDYKEKKRAANHHIHVNTSCDGSSRQCVNGLATRLANAVALCTLTAVTNSHAQHAGS